MTALECAFNHTLDRPETACRNTDFIETPMSRIALIANPISGSGSSRARAEALQQELEHVGHEVVLTWTRLEPCAQWLDPVLQDVDVAVVAGGDGTVRLVAESAIETRTPIYQVPTGTENLFARALGHSGEAGDVIRAIEAADVCLLDVADANGTTSILMTSCGFDAAVVQDLASRRTGPISHWTYLPSMLRQLWSWKPVPVGIMVDGEGVGSDQPGLCFVCNCREYGGGFNPAPDARMDDGLLDIVFLPTRSRLGLLRWMWKARRGTHLASTRALHARGRRIVLEPASPVPWQVDGDCPAESATPLTQRVTIEVRSGVLPVLRPAGDASRN
ncbi:MAG: hypothetical protein CMJ36_06260 [Phycisphaerae bacterium]|nr:hypothetical protein [Phycisphaerae bacterium]